MSALPSVSDIDLFGYREGIIYLDAEVSDGAFDFGVAEKRLDDSDIGAAFEQMGIRSL